MLCYNLAHHVVRAPSDCFQLALALFSLTLTEQQQVNIDLSRMEQQTLQHVSPAMVAFISLSLQAAVSELRQTKNIYIFPFWKLHFQIYIFFSIMFYERE